MNARTSKLLAEILLLGQWEPDAAVVRLCSCAGSFSANRTWPAGLIEAVFSAYPTAFGLTNHGLACFLRTSESVQRILTRANVGRQLGEWASTFDRLTLPSPEMRPRTQAAADWNVAHVTSVGQLAEQFGVELRRLLWMADCRGQERVCEREKLRNYRYRWVAKSGGNDRLIEVPKRNLKALQRWILDHIAGQIPAHEAAHGFVSGRSILSAARPHEGRHVVLRIDLRDFFSSISSARVSGVFRTAGYPESVVRVLTGLCTNSAWEGVFDLRDSRRKHETHMQRALRHPHLPQGSPVSPALANLVAYHLDCRLSGLAEKFDVAYTRYADDLIFSCGKSVRSALSRFRINALAIVINEGFGIRHRKTRIMHSYERQTVTGLVVNSRANVRRRDFDHLKAILTNCAKHGVIGQNRENHENFEAHLRGKVAWVDRVNPSKGRKLKSILKQIDFDDVAQDSTPGH